MLTRRRTISSHPTNIVEVSRFRKRGCCDQPIDANLPHLKLPAHDYLMSHTAWWLPGESKKDWRITDRARIHCMQVSCMLTSQGNGALTIDKTASFSSCRTAHFFFIFALAYHFFFIFFATLPRVLFSYTNFGRTEKFPFFVSEIWHTLFVNTNTLCVIFKPREDDRKPVTSKFQERIIAGLLIVRSIPSWIFGRLNFCVLPAPSLWHSCVQTLSDPLIGWLGFFTPILALFAQSSKRLDFLCLCHL